LEEEYTTKEISMKKDQEIIKIRSLNGWTWIKIIERNEEGWILEETIED